MSNLDGDVEDIYSMQNPNVEDAWKAVGFQHVTAITAEEMAHLPGHRQTAKLYGGQEGGAVLLEVFHQIHCLVRTSSLKPEARVDTSLDRHPQRLLRKRDRRGRLRGPGRTCRPLFQLLTSDVTLSRRRWCDDHTMDRE
jgi:hypothetical protein